MHTIHFGPACWERTFGNQAFLFFVFQGKQYIYVLETHH